MTPNEANKVFDALMAVIKMLDEKRIKMDKKIAESHSDHNYPAAWVESIASGIYTEVASDVEAMAKQYAEEALGQ